MRCMFCKDTNDFCWACDMAELAKHAIPADEPTKPETPDAMREAIKRALREMADANAKEDKGT